MSLFMQTLRDIQGKISRDDLIGKTVVYVPYDQLSDKIGTLSRMEASEVVIVILENSHKAQRRRYHKQKLLYVLSNSRHFAVEQARRGVKVIYRMIHGSFGGGLQQVAEEYAIQKILCMKPAERELRQELQGCVHSGLLEFTTHEGWLTTEEDLLVSSPTAPWNMGDFYKRLRDKHNILLENKKPVGGKYSLDEDNRLAWNGEPVAPEVPRFTVDAITEEVVRIIEENFPQSIGTIDAFSVPTTKEDARTLWKWAKENCLFYFGPFEDAMSTQSSSLFHTRISPLINLHRLLPKEIIADVLELDIPLNSKEGFVRQVLGWREFMYRIHEYTDGLRNIPTKKGVQTYYATSSAISSGASTYVEDMSTVNVLQATYPLPTAYWGTPSGFACLDHVVQQVLREGYTHHIPRLMVLANIANLLQVRPQEINEWFWVAFVDAYDWVVEPNVLGMGTFATGEVLSTKPYVAGASYIQKMSNFCETCAFSPKKNCPLTPLYWQLLDKNQQTLASNFRMKMIMASVRKRSEDQKNLDKKILDWCQHELQRGAALQPQTMPTPSGSRQGGLFD